MSRRVAELGVRLRPHVKTHKCVEIARIQTDGHDGSVTVSTLAEARAFAAAGFRNVTYAVPIEPGKFEEAATLARDGVRLNVITDDAATPASLNEACKRTGSRLGMFLEIDCGDHRSGVNPDREAVVTISREITEASDIDFAGLLTHGGHSYGQPSIDGVKAVATQERDVMAAAAEWLRSEGIEVPTVSIGSTPTIVHAEDLAGIDEVRPGNYILFDAFQTAIGSCAFDDCALTVLAAVVHRSFEQKKIIIDAGAIALSKDRGPVDRDPGCGYGRVLDLDGNDLGLSVVGVSQEHGVISVEDDTLLGRLKVGSRVRVLANHSCIAAAQHSHFNVLEGDEIVDRWEIHRGW